MKHCLVSGCSGFIGRHITATLREHAVEVRGLSRQPDTVTDLPCVYADLTEPTTLNGCAAGIDTVIHAAGHAHAYDGNDALHRQVTLEGTRQLLAESQRAGVQRFVFISSIKAMPEPADDCLDETADGTPADGYGRSRLQAEQIVLAAGREHGLHVSVLRPTLVYGAGCKGNLASLLRWIDRGWFPPLPDNGNRRSMVDVRDVATAAMQAATRVQANGQVCILEDGEDYSTARIIAAMRNALGRGTPGWSVPAGVMRALAYCGDGLEALTRRRALYNSAMYARLLGSACYHSVTVEQALGFRPRRRLEDALPAMVDAWRHNNRAA